MQRDSYNTVTVPILIPASKEWSEGETYSDDERVRVREFTDDDADKTITCGKESWDQLSTGEKTHILRFGDVLRALETKDQSEIEKAMLVLKSDSGPISQGVAKRLVKESGYIPDALIFELCRHLGDVRLVLWKQLDGRLAPGLLCANAATAYWIRTLWSAVGAKAGPRLCPKCSKMFTQTRADQEYCSIKCREAHRVERWRARSRPRSNSGQRRPKVTRGKGRKS